MAEMCWVGPTRCKARADIVQGGDHRRGAGDDIDPQGGHHQAGGSRTKTVNGEKAENGNHHLLGDSGPAQLDGAHRPGMDQVVQLQPGIFEEQQKADHLDAAAGGAGATADKHQGDQQEPADRRPDDRNRPCRSR